MVVKYKKLSEDAVAPVRANITDAGWDLTATHYEYEAKEKLMTYFTGIAIAIPEGFVGLLFPRSSVYKKSLSLANSVGVIDAGFRGEILFKYRVLYGDEYTVYHGKDRIGQIVVVPIADIFWDETHELPSSERGEGGFGSSDLEKLQS